MPYGPCLMHPMAQAPAALVLAGWLGPPQDTVVFSAEVLILKEVAALVEHLDTEDSASSTNGGPSGPGGPGANGALVGPMPTPPGPSSGGASMGLLGGGLLGGSLPGGGTATDVTAANKIAKRGVFTWRVENFLAFKDIMETRKIFSKFFSAGGCDLRIGKPLLRGKQHSSPRHPRCAPSRAEQQHATGGHDSRLVLGSLACASAAV